MIDPMSQSSKAFREWSLQNYKQNLEINRRMRFLLVSISKDEKCWVTLRGIDIKSQSDVS